MIDSFIKNQNEENPNQNRSLSYCHSEMAKLINNFDWNKTSLGPIDEWSDILLLNVNFILSTNIPLGIHWGKDLLLIYNDSWAKIITDKHPNALGRPVKEVFSEAWDQISPGLERVMAGEKFVHEEDQKLLLRRNNKQEEAWFDYSLSPILTKDGSVAGVLHTATEKTLSRKLIEQRNRLLIERTAVMDNLMEGLILADLSGKAFYLNKAALRLHGYGSLEEIGLPRYLYKKEWEVSDPNDIPIPVEAWPMSRIIDGESFTEYDLKVTRADKKVSFIGAFSGHLVKDEMGNPLFAMLIIRDISKQFEAENSLRNERELLQTMFDVIPIMLTVYNPKLDDFQMNKHLTRLTDWTMEDIQKTSIMELVYPDPVYREHISNYMQSLSPGFKDILMTAKDGHVLETSWANVKIPDGRQVGIGVDISERIKAEKALEEYSDRLRFLHEIDEAILSSQTESEISQAVVQRLPKLIPDCVFASVIMLDYEQQAVTCLAHTAQIKEHVNQAVSMRDFLLRDANYENLRQGLPIVVNNLDQIPETAIIMRCLDSKEIKSHIYYPIIIKNKLVGTLNIGLKTEEALSMDQIEIISEVLTPLRIGIEQTRLHERNLEINRRLLETVINNIPVAISLIRGSDFHIIYANPTYYAITPGKQLLGSSLNEIWDTTKYNYNEICKNVLELNEPFFIEDDEMILHRTPDSPAEKTYFTWWLFPIDIPDENEKGILNMAYETTDRKLAEIALIEAERLTTIGRMAASLAHEINNPLQSVIGCLGLAEEMIESGNNPDQFMDVAMEELIRTSQIVKRMRDLGRSEEMEKKPGHVEEDLEKVILLTQKQAKDQQIEVLYKEQEDLPEVIFASDQIRQVFLNLILNAIDSMPEGGNLNISINETKGPDGVQIKFADTGIGIKPDQLDYIFEAFHSNKQSGLGLGLYISRRIIDSHHGRVDVDSEVGKGTTFTIWLPLTG